MLPNDPTGHPALADAAFAEYVERRAAGEELEFEAWCALHPDLATELRELHAAEALVERWLPGGAEAALTTSPAQPTSRRYHVRREIGRGGMGIVLEVWDEEMLRPLAMKLGVGRTAIDARARARFVDEARVAGQLDHPGIVPVHEVGADADGVPFYTMRLVDGVDVRGVIESAGSGSTEWTQVRVLGVLLRVCEAMSYAHSRGVIHRDLKPANVMVGRFGEVYVMDWGLARVVASSNGANAQPAVSSARSAAEAGEEASPLATLEGEAVGTPHFMSPEQAQGQLDRVGPRSDVYSVGAMLYEVLAGVMPYAVAGESVSSRVVLERVRVGPPSPLHSSRRSTPPELVAICERAMARRIEDRYPSMQALGDDIRAYLERRVVRAYESGTWAETRMWLRRNRTVAAALATALVVLAVGAVVGVVALALAHDRNVAEGIDETLRRLDALRDAGRSDSTDARYLAADEWLRVARETVEGHTGDPTLPGLAGVERMLEDVRARAKPRPATAIAADRERHPRAAELQYRRAELAWYDRMLGRTDWPPEPTLAEALGNVGLTETTSARDINFAAWALVDPRNPLFGAEGEGLVLARRAVALAGQAKLAMAARDTLAWASYRRHEFAAAIELYGNGLPMQDGTDEMPSLATEVRDWEDGTAAAEREMLAEQLSLGDAEVAEAGTFEFDDLRDDRSHRELSQLVVRLRALDRRSRDAASAAVSRAWIDVRASLGEDPRFQDFTLEPQIDLLPLGKDRASGLLEFAHLPSGRAPDRRPDDGQLVLRADTGLVFVLVPAGGAVHAPFFLAKYEMTLAQWERLTGRWTWRRGRALGYPFRDVTWTLCRDALRDADGWLRLPTFEEWEHARRAGTTGRFWTGEDPASLEDAENIRLDAAKPFFVQRPGVLRPNPFGLFDMEGNVLEWCADASKTVVGDGLRSDYPAFERRYCGYDHSRPHEEKSDATTDDPPGGPEDSSVRSLGLRPARSVTRASR